MQALNPGNITSGLARTASWNVLLFRKFSCYPTIKGAYTEIFAATSPEVTLEKSGAWGKEKPKHAYTPYNHVIELINYSGSIRTVLAYTK